MVDKWADETGGTFGPRRIPTKTTEQKNGKLSFNARET